MKDSCERGLLMPEEVITQVRERYYFVEEDPMSKRRRLFFDNSGGSFRLKAAGDAFAAADNLPNCAGHGGAASDYLDSLRRDAQNALAVMFHATEGTMVTSMTASIILFDVTEAIIENCPGKNVVTTQLEHPSAFDACAATCKKCGKELRVARTNPATGTVDAEEIIRSVDKDTCLLSVIMTSNITGAILDIETIVRECRKINPELYIVCDSVQHTPHGIFDLQKCPVDAVNFAPYKFGGMRGLGAGWLSARASVLPHRRLIEERADNWEMGGCAPGSYAQLCAIFDYVCWLGSNFTGSSSKREQYIEGMTRITLHERALLDRMLGGSAATPGVRDIAGVHCPADGKDLTKRDLIVPLVFDKLTCEEAARAYEREGVVVHERTDRSLYSRRQVNSFGCTGIVRVSPLHCHRPEEIDSFLEITAKIAAQ